MSERPERRCLEFRLPERHIVDLVNIGMGRWTPEFITLPRLSGVDIPADAELLDMTCDWETRDIIVRMSHPSFPVWEEGALCPRAAAWQMAEVTAVRLERVGDSEGMPSYGVSRVVSRINPPTPEQQEAILKLAREQPADPAPEPEPDAEVREERPTRGGYF